MTQALIELSDLGFSWPGHPPLLDIPAFRLSPGETLFLKGPSGSGKTTLLGLLGGVQKPDRGSIRLLGQELTKLSAGARDHFRVDHTGYIFQQFNLPKAAGCVVENQELESPLFGATPEADDDHDEDADEHHHDHSEIHARYQFTCATPNALTTLDLANIFNSFPATQKIEVQLIGPNGQQGVEVTATAASLKF